MWVYQGRLLRLLADFCSRTLIFRDGGCLGLLQMNSRSCSFATASWNHCKLIRKCILKPKVTRRHYTNTRQNTENEAETLSQPSTLIYLLKWGVASLVVTVFVSTTVVWSELWLLKQKMSDVMSSVRGGELETGLTVPRIFPWQRVQMNSQKTEVSLQQDDSGVWHRWLQSKSDDPFTLLELCRSNNLAIHRLGVKALAAKTAWEDYQYRYVAQAADFKTLIGLSRSHGSDARFFLEPPTLVPNKMHATEELASLLLLLEQELQQESDCEPTMVRSATTRASMLAHQRLHQGKQASYDKLHFWGFEGSAPDTFVEGQVAEDQLLQHCLTALAQLCCIPSQALLFIKRNGLATLQRVMEQYENMETFTTVASVLGNLALHPSTHQPIVHAGWLGVLKRWTEGQSSKLAVSAARVLANMDRDWTTHLLDDGIVLLHPLHRSRKTVHADIVFVHGLLGGAVKTWRQQDRAAKAQPEGSYLRTDCWPKDWLANDCPHVRIISVHYDTALSTWSGNKNADEEKCTLEQRGRELLDKLHKAGVGQRPIIWVGHSMGGLLIKQILALSNSEANNCMQEQTCGLLLYSVPHHGLSIAAFSSQVHFLFFPTTEVQELRADSPHLNRLHQCFKNFVEQNGIPCLSFGELNKTALGKKLPSVLLVPAQSSDPGVGEFCTLPLNHIDICKPSSQDSILYRQTVTFIHRCIFFSYMHRFRKGMSGSME